MNGGQALALLQDSPLQPLFWNLGLETGELVTPLQCRATPPLQFSPQLVAAVGHMICFAMSLGGNPLVLIGRVSDRRPDIFRLLIAALVHLLPPKRHSYETAFSFASSILDTDSCAEHGT